MPRINKKPIKSKQATKKMPIKNKKTISLEKKINKILAEVRPALQMDGGDVELESVKNGIVVLNVKGACHGCPMATITFGQGVAGLIQEKIPEIKEVRYW